MMATGSGVSPRNLAGTGDVGAELRRVEISVGVAFCVSEEAVQQDFASNSGSGVNWEQDFVFARDHICAVVFLHLLRDWSWFFRAFWYQQPVLGHCH